MYAKNRKSGFLLITALSGALMTGDIALGKRSWGFSAL